MADAEDREEALPVTALPPVVFWIWSAVCACSGGMVFLLLCQLLAGWMFGDGDGWDETLALARDLDERIVPYGVDR